MLFPELDRLSRYVAIPVVVGLLEYTLLVVDGMVSKESSSSGCVDVI